MVYTLYTRAIKCFSTSSSKIHCIWELLSLYFSIVLPSYFCDISHFHTHSLTKYEKWVFCKMPGETNDFFSLFLIFHLCDNCLSGTWRRKDSSTSYAWLPAIQKFCRVDFMMFPWQLQRRWETNIQHMSNQSSLVDYLMLSNLFLFSQNVSKQLLYFCAPVCLPNVLFMFIYTRKKLINFLLSSGWE